MKGARTVIIVIIVFVVALLLGLMIGFKQVSDVKKKLSTVETDLRTKVSTLEGNLAKARAQKELSVCKWELVQARTNASARNFGKASESLAAAKEAFSRAVAVSVSTPAFSARITPIQPAFDEIKAGLEKNDVTIVGKLEGVITQLEPIISE